ncbi:VOC family protein [Nonomuraea sp. NPDC000554]
MSARGLHHTELISSDVERTIRFYQDVLEFPPTEADRRPLGDIYGTKVL